ncbi:MAG TPA: DUF4175 family protein [Gemmatimonadaceae bacterium]
MSPDAKELRAFLDRVGRQLRLIAGAHGAAFGLGLAVIATLAGWPFATVGRAGAVGIALGAFGCIISILLTRPAAPALAAYVERRVPQCRNVVVTGTELLSLNTSANDYVASLVWRDAARTARTLTASRIASARRALTVLGIAAAIFALALARMANPALAALAPLARHSATAGAATIDRIDVIVTPPPYASLPPTTLHDPQRIDALAGSTVNLSVRGRAAAVTIETLNGTRIAATQRNGAYTAYTANVAADGDGYIAIQATAPSTGAGATNARRLIGLSVTPDNAPRVRITAPAKDITLSDAHTALDITADAADDIGLATLRLRYTKVSGADERYTFVEGEVPLEITRRDARTWTARVHWPLDSLALAPGDMVVYRAVATDHRPGSVASESDAYIAELPAPGGNAAAGFSLDPTEDRYAVSQQMVIMKTERLLAGKSGMSADAISSEAQDIAAEQRKVRAEFVFMMGGEVADAPDPSSDMTSLNETAEAEGESDLAAGRMFNQGRVALQTAIRAMSRAATSLATSNVATALPSEREALAQLEQAFSRTRIILRALTQQEQLDLTRRLSGSLTDVVRNSGPSANPAADPRVTALRSTLAEIASLSGGQNANASTAAAASALAQRVLTVDPSDAGLQAVAATLDSAGTSATHSDEARTRAQLDRAATSLAALLRRNLLSAPSAPSGATIDRLNGALTDALRPAGGAP